MNNSRSEITSGVNNPAEIASSQAPRKDGGGNVVDLTDAFDKVPTFEEIEKHVRDIIASGEAFDTLSPDWKIDIKGGNRTVNKITNQGNFQKLQNSARKRHNKYVKAIKNLINNAVYSHSDKNTKPKEKPDVLNYHYFNVNVKVGDKVYSVLLECEETKNVPQGRYAKRNYKSHRNRNSINQNNNGVKTVHLYNIKEIKKNELSKTVATSKAAMIDNSNNSITYFQDNYNPYEGVNEIKGGLRSGSEAHSAAHRNGLPRGFAPRNCACQVISYIFVSKNSERRMKQVTKN